MKDIPIQHTDDPRIDLYRNLKDKALRQDHGVFLAEGEHLVRRLLASTFQVRSVFVLESKSPSFAESIPPEVTVYLADKSTLSQIVGFPFHRGVLAIGERPADQSLEQVLRHNTDGRWVICPELNDVENLGSLMRTAAALGVRQFLLGSSCCDPLARRALRTSMGAAFNVTLIRSQHLKSDLLRLKDQAHITLHAAVLDPAATPLQHIQIPSNFGLVFGTEAQGLAPEWWQLCDQSVTLPMQNQVDSLNITVAAGILLYAYAKRAAP